MVTYANDDEFLGTQFMYWGLQPVHGILPNTVRRIFVIFLEMFVQNIGIWIIYYFIKISIMGY